MASKLVFLALFVALALAASVESGIVGVEANTLLRSTPAKSELRRVRRDNEGIDLTSNALDTEGDDNDDDQEAAPLDTLPDDEEALAKRSLHRGYGGGFGYHRPSYGHRGGHGAYYGGYNRPYHSRGKKPIYFHGRK